MGCISIIFVVGAIALISAGAQAASDRGSGWGPQNELTGAFPAMPSAPAKTTEEKAQPWTNEQAATPAPAPKVAAAPVGRDTSCGKVVVAQSANAVGDPCATTESFTASLNLTKAQLARLSRFQRTERVAH
jgi:hypothetical protein